MKPHAAIAGALVSLSVVACATPSKPYAALPITLDELVLRPSDYAETWVRIEGLLDYEPDVHGPELVTDPKRWDRGDTFTGNSLVMLPASAPPASLARQSVIVTGKVDTRCVDLRQRMQTFYRQNEGKYVEVFHTGDLAICDVIYGAPILTEATIQAAEAKQ